MFKRLLISFSFFLIANSFGSTIYWAGLSSNWNDSINWFLDAGFTIPGSIPTASDDVVLVGAGSAPVVNLSAWTAPNSIDSTAFGAAGIYFNSSSPASMTATVTGNAVFQGMSQLDGTVTGNAVFDNASAGTMLLTSSRQWGTGSAGSYVGGDFLNITMFIFQDSSINAGSVPALANAEFHDDAYNAGTLNGSFLQKFYDNAYNEGTVNGEAEFHGSSYNSGLITTNAYFNNLSRNDGTVSGSAYYDTSIGGVMSLNDNRVWGFGTSGGDNGQDAIPITSWVFNDTSSNSGIITNSPVFNDLSSNQGIINSDATFHDMSFNQGTINGNAYFSASIGGVMTVSGTSFWGSGTSFANMGGDMIPVSSWIFLDSSTNQSAISGASFYDNSVNTGYVHYGTFYDNSVNTATITTSSFYDNAHNDYQIDGDGIFYDNSYNNGGVTGNMVIYDSAYNNGTVGNLYFSAATGNSITFVGSQQYGSGTVIGQILDNTGGGIYTFYFTDDSQNNGVLPALANAEFHDNACNNGTINGSYAQKFYDNACNNGTIISGQFNNSSVNGPLGIANNAYFHGGTANNGVVATPQYDCGAFDHGNKKECSGGGSSSSIDSEPPMISQILTTPQTDHGSIGISFQSNEPVNGYVEYREHGKLIPRATFQDSSLAISQTVHTGILTGLGYCTLYDYRVVAFDTNGNKATSPESQFTTFCEPESTLTPLSIDGSKDITTPLVSDFQLQVMSQTGSVMFKTNEPAIGTLSISLSDTSTVDITTTSQDFVTMHQVLFDDLEICRNYTYNLQVRDVVGNLGLAKVGGFTTAGCPNLQQPILPPVETSQLKPSAEKNSVPRPLIVDNSGGGGQNSTNNPQNVDNGNSVDNGQTSNGSSLLLSNLEEQQVLLSLCGNNIVEDGEQCDEISDLCSYQCTLITPVLTDSGSTKTDNTSEAESMPHTTILSSFLNRSSKRLSTIGSNPTVQKTISVTKKALEKSTEEAIVVVQYSAVGVTSLLSVLFIALNVMIFFSTWTTYTVQVGESIADIATRFNMVESALIRNNPALKNGLQEGMKLKVKDRPFLEKDYLDKLKDIFKGTLQKRKYI